MTFDLWTWYYLWLTLEVGLHLYQLPTSGVIYFLRYAGEKQRLKKEKKEKEKETKQNKYNTMPRLALA